jgi:hypothetical protein
VVIDFLEHPGKSCSPDESGSRVLPKGIIDRYRVATNRFPQPVDWRYKLIRRLLAHC